MLQHKLYDLKQYILKYNTYFDMAFDNVYQDEQTGYISDGSQIIFPADNFGAYFYLRNIANGSFDNNSIYKLSDTANGIGVKANVTLVACMRNADSDRLLDNVIDTIRHYIKENIQLVSFLMQTSLVVSQELSKIPKSDLQSVLQRIVNDNYSVVSVNFNITAPLPLQKLNCITNPCKTC